MILTFVFVEFNAAMIAVKLKCTKDVVMSWCIGQKLGTCTVFTKTTSNVTERWYCILTFQFVNLENEQPLKIETVYYCSPRNKDKFIVNMITNYNVIRQWYGLGACKLCNICFIDDNALKKIIFWDTIKYR